MMKSLLVGIAMLGFALIASAQTTDHHNPPPCCNNELVLIGNVDLGQTRTWFGSLKYTSSDGRFDMEACRTGDEIFINYFESMHTRQDGWRISVTGAGADEFHVNCPEWSFKDLTVISCAVAGE